MRVWPSADASARISRVRADAMVQEIVDETNIPMHVLEAPVLIGAMQDETCKPDLLFLTRTSLDTTSVRHAMAAGATEGWESDRLVFWPVPRIEDCTLPLTPVTHAAFECLSEMLRL